MSFKNLKEDNVFKDMALVAITILVSVVLGMVFNKFVDIKFTWAACPIAAIIGLSLNNYIGYSDNQPKQTIIDRCIIATSSLFGLFAYFV